MDRRALLVFALLAILLLGMFWLVKLEGDPAGPASLNVYVVAPDGSLFASGLVAVSSATALHVLQELARMHDFPLLVERMPGFAGCSASYVRGIGPYEETPTGGWNFYVRTPGGSWSWQSYGAGCALPPNVEVEWCWVERDVCAHHVS
jgi:hypothetical protein